MWRALKKNNHKAVKSKQTLHTACRERTLNRPQHKAYGDLKQSTSAASRLNAAANKHQPIKARPWSHHRAPEDKQKTLTSMKRRGSSRSKQHDESIVPMCNSSRTVKLHVRFKVWVHQVTPGPEELTFPSQSNPEVTRHCLLTARYVQI